MTDLIKEPKKGEITEEIKEVKKEEENKDKKKTAEEGKKGKSLKSKGKKKNKKSVSHAHIYIKADFNNTIVTITDVEGNVVAWSSAGNCGFKGAKQGTPYAAQVATEKALEKAKIFGVQEVDIFIKGLGAGRDQAVRGVVSYGDITVLSISDNTSIPHGGCRPKKVRRV